MFATNPVHHEPDAARAAGYADVVAPPTFAVVVQEATLAQLLAEPDAGIDFSRVVHGEQSFTYDRPIVAGDELTATLTVTSVKTLGGNAMVTAQSTMNDEALLVRDLAAGRKVLLVTSAGHLPRAVQIFESEGLVVVAAPTDYGFVRRGSPRDHWWHRWIPSAEGIGTNHGWLYEQVAELWQTIRQLSGTNP